MGIKKWSKTANSNDSISSSAGTINWKEGMPPSAVNDSARVTMADVRDWYEDAQWVNLGDADGTTSPRRAATEISLSGTHTATYHVGRRLKALDTTGTKYGTITATTFSGGTQITLALDSGTLTGSVSQVWLGAMTRTSPSNPVRACFSAVNSSSDANATGDGTAVTVEFDTELGDKGGDFSTTTDTFTARDTGLHRFSATVRLSGLTASHTRILLQVITSNRNYLIFDTTGAARTSSNEIIIGGSIIADMDAADTAFVRLIVSGSTKVVGIEGSTSDPGTIFSGEFLTV